MGTPHKYLWCLTLFYLSGGEENLHLPPIVSNYHFVFMMALRISQLFLNPKKTKNPETRPEFNARSRTYRDFQKVPKTGFFGTVIENLAGFGTGTVSRASLLMAYVPFD